MKFIPVESEPPKVREAVILLLVSLVIGTVWNSLLGMISILLQIQAL